MRCRWGGRVGWDAPRVVPRLWEGSLFKASNRATSVVGQKVVRGTRSGTTSPRGFYRRRGVPPLPCPRRRWCANCLRLLIAPVGPSCHIARHLARPTDVRPTPVVFMAATSHRRASCLLPQLGEQPVGCSRPLRCLACPLPDQPDGGQPTPSCGPSARATSKRHTATRRRWPLQYSGNPAPDPSPPATAANRGTCRHPRQVYESFHGP